MKKTTLFLLLCTVLSALLSIQNVHAQRVKVPSTNTPKKTDTKNTNNTNNGTHKIGERKFDKNRLTIGGDFGANFSGDTYIQIMPLIGYRFTDKLTTGLGPSFSYIKPQSGTATTILGGRAYGEYALLKNIFLHGEYGLETAKQGDYKTSYQRLPLGAGISFGGFNASFLYDVLYKDGKTPYSEPWMIRVGGGFNL